MDFELSIINGKTVSDVIRAHRDECIGIVRDAYLAPEILLGSQNVVDDVEHVMKANFFYEVVR